MEFALYLYYISEQICSAQVQKHFAFSRINGIVQFSPHKAARKTFSAWSIAFCYAVAQFAPMFSPNILSLSFSKQGTKTIFSIFCVCVFIVDTLVANKHTNTHTHTNWLFRPLPIPTAIPKPKLLQILV